MSKQARYRPKSHLDHRQCRYRSCESKTIRGHAFCERHAVSEDAVEYYKELDRAAAYFDFALQTLDPDEIERSQAFHRFRRRVQRGDFSRLLDKPTQDLIEQAAKRTDLGLELGILRFALVRAVAEETDPSRMGVTIARLANAIARLTLAKGAARDAQRGPTGAVTELDDLAERFLSSALATAPATAALVGDRQPSEAVRAVGNAGSVNSLAEGSGEERGSPLSQADRSRARHTTSLPLPQGEGDTP